MSERHDHEDPEIPEWIIDAAKAVGMNGIRVRWKLLHWHRAWRRWRRDLAPASRRFEHQICTECGAVQARDATVCTSCKEKLSAPAARFLRTLGLSIPTALSVSSALGVAMLLVYVRMMMANPGQGIWGWEPETFLAHGGLFPPLLQMGQWWRLSTAVFLHLGIFHLGFNLVALTQIGPDIEEIFGRGRMVFFFVLTGVISFAASALAMPMTQTAGASGAVMGLIGVAAGWGQRVGTSHGKEVRNQMLQWGVYTTLFGIMLNANHVAHGAGFVAGAILGYAFNPHQLAHTKGSTLSSVLGTVGALAAVATVMLAIFPPAASRNTARQLAGKEEEEWVLDEGDDPIARMAEAVMACELYRQGKIDEARAKLNQVKGGGEPGAAADIELACKSLDQIREQCKRFDASGLEAVEGELPLPDDHEEREERGKMWRQVCAAFTSPKAR